MRSSRSNETASGRRARCRRPSPPRYDRDGDRDRRRRLKPVREEVPRVRRHVAAECEDDVRVPCQRDPARVAGAVPAVDEREHAPAEARYPPWAERLPPEPEEVAERRRSADLDNPARIEGAQRVGATAGPDPGEARAGGPRDADPGGNDQNL